MEGLESLEREGTHGEKAEVPERSKKPGLGRLFDVKTISPTHL